jgi:hypothetical protein
LKDEQDEDVLEEPLAPGPGTAEALEPRLDGDSRYRIQISAGGARCRWVLAIGPPGAMATDAPAPPRVPCVPPAEQSSGEQEDGLEPNETIDQVVPVDDAFERAGADATEADVATGRIGSENDEEWFGFCSTGERREITVRLKNHDVSEDTFSERCTDLTVRLLDASGRDPTDEEPLELPRNVREIAWTTEPDTRYYIVVSEGYADRCRWRLSVGPPSALTDTLPLAAWNG